MVNGRTIREIGIRVDIEKDTVAVDGTPVQTACERTYIMLHKPIGVVSTVDDPQGRPTVVDLVDSAVRLFPVGRLDVTSEGLLLLTNDGGLTHRLTHPSFEVEKEYHVLLDRELDSQDLQEWQAGVMLDGKRTAPVRIDTTGQTDNEAWIHVTMREGRKRQIREIARELGYSVLRLIRVREGSLFLGDLPSGQWRVLQPDEIHTLHSHAQPATQHAPTRASTARNGTTRQDTGTSYTERRSTPQGQRSHHGRRRGDAPYASRGSSGEHPQELSRRGRQQNTERRSHATAGAGSKSPNRYGTKQWNNTSDSRYGGQRSTSGSNDPNHSGRRGSITAHAMDNQRPNSDSQRTTKPAPGRAWQAQQEEERKRRPISRTRAAYARQRMRHAMGQSTQDSGRPRQFRDNHDESER